MLTVPGTEPHVACVVTTAVKRPSWCGKTVRSVLAQRWPADRLWVIVSDDAHSDAMSAVVDELRAESPEADLSYHRPARRGTPERRGEAKAGNLNSRLRPRAGERPHHRLLRDAGRRRRSG